MKTCPPLKDTKQATVSQNSRECKAVAKYTCKDKTLTILGSGEKICNTSGLWEGSEPKCISKFIQICTYSIERYPKMIVIGLSFFTDPNLNIALRKPVTMSSYSKKWSQGPSNNLVDGIRYGNKRDQLIHTEDEYRPWIMIDLQREVLLNFLLVINCFSALSVDLHEFLFARDHVLSDIQLSPSFGSSLHIRYNRAAHAVNSAYKI